MSSASKKWPSASSAAPAIAPLSKPSAPLSTYPARLPRYAPSDTASAQSRSDCVETITAPALSFRTNSRSMIRTIPSRLSRSSSGRISPRNWLPSKATLQSWIGPIDSATSGPGSSKSGSSISIASRLP